jgi:hypothetical protein
MASMSSFFCVGYVRPIVAAVFRSRKMPFHPRKTRFQSWKIHSDAACNEKVAI